jgi:hypothetical protein
MLHWLYWLYWLFLEMTCKQTVFRGPSRPAGPADYSADQSNAGAPPVAAAHRPVLSAEQSISSNHIVTHFVNYFY